MQITPGALLLFGILAVGRADATPPRPDGGAEKVIPPFMFGALSRIGCEKRRPRVEDTVTHTFETGAGGRLALAAAIGDVEVVAAETNVVKLDILRSVDAAGQEEAARVLGNLLVETSQQGRDVTVRVRFRRETPDDERRRVNLRFRISVPRSFNLDVSTVGSFRAGDLRGGVRVETAGGDITLGRIQGEVVATSAGGRVSVVGAEGPLKLATGGGPASVEDAASTVEAETAGGPFRATLSAQPRSASSIRTSGGRIELRIGEGVGVELDAAASGGHIASEYGEPAGRKSKRDALRAAINGGGPALVLRSDGGGINLVRGPAGAGKQRP